MIIVEQNKDIVNFSRVSEIKIVDYEAQKESLGKFVSALIANVGIDDTKLSGYGIYAYFEKDNWSVLGEYKTEGRAKEVLKDFISRYEAIELCKREDSEIFGYTLGDYTPIYEMPED